MKPTELKRFLEKRFDTQSVSEAIYVPPKPAGERTIQDGATWEVLFGEYVGGSTLEQIGIAHGVTRERIRQIVTKYASENGMIKTRIKAKKGLTKSQDTIQAEEYLEIRRSLIQLLSRHPKTFPRKGVLRLTGFSDHLTDLEICSEIRSTYSFIRMGPYRWCSMGKHVVAVAEWGSPKSLHCKACNANRMAKRYRALGWREAQGKYADPVKQRIYYARYTAKKSGRKLPPLDVPFPPQKSGWGRVLELHTPQEIAEIVSRREATRKETIKRKKEQQCSAGTESESEVDSRSADTAES